MPPKRVKCSFCGGEVEPGTGIMYVMLDGSIRWYCSSKCFKSAVKLKRDARRVGWVKSRLKSSS